MIPKILNEQIAGFEPAEQQMVVSAFECAAIHLATRTRGDNHPFIEHPLGVVSIVVKELGLRADAVTAILLHEANRFETENIQELNRTALFESFRSRYPKDIIDMVTGLNNIAAITVQQTNLDPEKYRKLIVSYSTDPRVVLIKIADRLEVMRNIRIFPAARQRAKITETMMLYTPLAHQLGLYRIKSEFEDLYLKLSEPASYKAITAKLRVREKNMNSLMESFVNPLKEKLTNSGIRYTVKVRMKSPYSIWKKMQTKGLPFEEIYDIYAMRFIVECGSDHTEEEELCWKVYSLVTEEYTPDTSRLRDWISKPRDNGYESLHTTVLTKEGWVEVQIRTERMDFVAEQGHAAHWSYKGIKSGNEGFTNWLNSLRNLMQSTENENEKYEQSELMFDEILVFTPTGDLRQLRKGATVLDFAFEIHTNLGLKCSGARVNGKIASIRDQLHSGDVVDIIANKNQKPNADWLNFVVSSKARSKIKQKLKEEENKRAAIGKELLDRRLKNWKLTMGDDQLAELVKNLKYKTINEFFGAVGEGVIDPVQIKDFLLADRSSQPQAESREHTATQHSKPQLAARLKNFDYKVAKCCNPNYGDEVFGFLTIRDGIKIHSVNCPNASRLRENYPYRILEIEWKKPDKEVNKKDAEKGDTHKGRKGK
ncbi:MAG: bifunctional (p)ppGpp synthetase/guanosine-3',5'-bis(diphosphate) 3'-pyrophosphohydrolase [Bacteroidales bacterium]|nr:bifunctional (p)ppGpp synthetase/guanosine-3',5'-bis(diphosphate) 3'-pyrophosphohydrolase [Candidatus Cacconaster merdequi]